MSVSAPLPIVHKPSESEKALQIVLILATFVYPGPVSLGIAAYIAYWTRTRHSIQDYLAFVFILIIGLAVFVLTFAVVEQTISGFVESVTTKDFGAGVTNLLFLWVLGVPVAPLGGVFMSIWRELWQIITGRVSLEGYLQRSLKQQEEAAVAEVRAAQRRTAQVPPPQRGELRLGPKVGSFANFSEELGVRRRGEWITLDEAVLDTHMLVIGSSGQGKTETLKRLIAEILANTKRNIIFIDGKGDEQLARDFQNFVWEHRKQKAPVFKLGHQIKGSEYNGFSGTAEAIYNRLFAMVSMGDNLGAAEYYERLNALILYLVCMVPEPVGPPCSFFDLGQRLDKNELLRLWGAYPEKVKDVDALKDEEIQDLARKLKLIIYQFDDLITPEGFTLEDVGSCFFSLRTGSAGYTSNMLIKFLLEDINDFLGNRQKEDTVFFIDEFGVFGSPHIVKVFNILAQGRYAKLGAVLSTQGPSGLGDVITKERIIDNTGTKVLMSMVNPEPIAVTAGTVKNLEVGQQIDEKGPTNMGTVREQDAFAIGMNTAANLPRGHAFIIRKRKNVLVHIARATPSEVLPDDAGDTRQAEPTIPAT